MSYLKYWAGMIRTAVIGGKAYYAWLAVCGVLALGGVYAYVTQLQQGLIVTNMSDQVSWGAYIANFTFLVGVAAAAVLLVVPSYVFHHKGAKEVVLLGELLAVSAIVMCLMFVLVDIGHPERALHTIPFIGKLNFPASILAWDVIVLQGYLLLNLHIPGYLLYRKYQGKEATDKYYLPFVFISIFWALSIHTVTAFLYSGLGGRPYWNAAILAPRFLVSAFASGPAILIITFSAINKFGDFEISDSVFSLLKRIIAVTVPVNMFLLGCELFKEFYTGTAHVASAEYLYFGLHGHAMLSPYIWGSIALNTFALVVFVTPKYRERTKLVLAACAACVIGIWIEKGMGLIIPGFIPTPLGDLVEYTPSMVEFFVCLGIWAFGALLFTGMSRVALAIQSGTLRA